MTNFFSITYIDYTITPICVSSDNFNREGVERMLADERRGEIRILSIYMATAPDYEESVDVTADFYMVKAH